MDNKVKKEYKNNLKRGMIELCCEIPVLIACTVGFYFLNLPNWLTILLTVCIGALVFIVIEIVSFYILKHKKQSDSLKPKKFDPYSD